MGAYLAKHFSMRVAHVEAGLRSHNWLNPFPEEIDRVLTSRCVRLHFAPGQEAAANLSKAKGLVVNTTYNTIADSLAYSRTIPCKDPVIAELQSAPYFLNLWSIILYPRLLHKTFSYDTRELRCSPEDSFVNSFSYLFR